MLKLKMMLCVMMLPLVVVGCIGSLSVVVVTTCISGDESSASRLADTAGLGLLTLREAGLYTKTLERQKYINEQCR